MEILFLMELNATKFPFANNFVFFSILANAFKEGFCNETLEKYIKYQLCCAPIFRWS
jgi:hypothetical protein